MGNENKLKDSRFIARFEAVSARAGMIMVSYNGKPRVMCYERDTEWNWTKDVKSLNDLRNRVGRCLAIDMKKIGDKAVLSSVSVLDANAEDAKYQPVKIDGEISAGEFYGLLKGRKLPNEAVLLDVREASELMEEPGVMAIGAVNIPLSNFVAQLPQLNKSKKYYIFCTNGGRSMMAKEILARNGFSAIYVNVTVFNDEKDNLYLGDDIIIDVEDMPKLTLAKKSVRAK